MPPNDFRHSFTWGDYQRDRDLAALAGLLEETHTGGWCGSCGRWIADAATSDECECGGTVDIEGGGDG